jgi:hypothetical protein
VDQFYFEEGYLEVSYFTVIREANSALTFAAALQAQVDIALTTGYYIPDYIAPDYFFSGALVEATGAFTSNFSTVIVGTNIKEFSSAQTTQFSQTANATRVIEYAAAFTAAFTPTLTADAFKNHTAVLDTTSTLSVDAVANKAANVLLDYLADLNAQSVKTASATSAMAASATLSAQAIKTTNSASAFTLTAQVTADIQNVQLASAAMDSRFTQFTSRYLGSGRPRTLTAPSFSSTAKYGSNSLQSSAGSDGNTVKLPPPKPNQDWVYESYIYPTTSTVTQASILDIAAVLFLELRVNTNRTVQIVVNNHTGGVRTVLYSATSSAVSVGAWHHLTVVKNSTQLSFYVDGSRVGTVTASAGWDSYGSSSSPNLVEVARSNLFLDESSIAYGTTYGHDPSATTITVPTSARVNDPATTQYLHHWDGNGVDDILVQQFAQAALASTATVLAQVNGNTKQGAANLSTTVAFTVAGGETQAASASLTSAFTQTTTATRFARFDSALTATATQSTTIGTIKQFASANFVAFTSSMDIDAQLAGVALLETRATIAITAVKTTDIISTQSSSLVQTTSAIVTADANSALSVIATQSATGTRQQQGAVALSTTVSQSTEIDAINNYSAALSTQTTISATITRQRNAVSAFTSTATQTTAIEFTHDSIVAFAAAASQTVINDRLRLTASDLDSAFDYTLDDTLFKGLGAVIAAAVNQTATANYTASAQIDQDAIAIQMSVAAKNAVSGVDLDTTSTLTATVTRIRELDYGIPNFASTGLDTSIGEYYISAPPTTVLSDGFTLSFWAKRDSLENNYKMTILRPQFLNGVVQSVQFIDGVWEDAPDRTYTFSNAVRLAYPWDADEPIQYWQNAVATDIYWHHYLIRLVNDNPGDYQLWVDGVQKTRSGTITNNIGPLYNGRAYLGPEFDGALAQIWAGYIPNNQFAVTEFYQGTFVDLGLNGRGLSNQLPQPEIYNLLSDPWLGLNETQLTPSQIPLLYTGIIGLFDIAIQPQAVLVNAGALYADSNLTVLTSYRIDLDLDLSTTTTFTAEATTQIGILSDQSAAFNSTAAITKTTGYQSALSTQVTLFARGGYELELIADLSSSALLEADFDNIPPTRAEAQLNSVFTFTAEPNSFTDATILVASLGTLSADITVIPPIRVEADLTVTATLSAIIGEIEQFAVLVASTGTMTTNAVKTTGAVQNISSEFTQTANATKFTGIVANWSAFYSNLTAGDVINLDPALTYQIPQETREYQILPESRLYVLQGESRELIILKG